MVERRELMPERTYKTGRAERRYSASSVSRALNVLMDKGVVRSWSPPQGDRNFIVDLFDYGPMEGSVHIMHAIVLGAVSAMKRAEREEKE
jgi:hypothetical protein